LIAEADETNPATRSNYSIYYAMYLAALRGREPESSTLIETGLKSSAAARQGTVVRFAQSVTATLYNGLAHYDRSLAAAREACEHPRDWGSHFVLPELIEAAVRSGHPDLAGDAFEQLSQTTTASGTDWALGIEARSSALLTEGSTAEEHYREALERLGHTQLRVEMARTHLLYGEWLRRERRRLDAREQLRTAHNMLNSIGAEGFAERARIELQATGETARKRVPETSADLTAQEAQICRLAADGSTNAEIAVRLFISASTVDYHLRKAFRKLGVRSRTQLARQLAR
jgi:DNA-binding CsgD family transcriptional regulator